MPMPMPIIKGTNNLTSVHGDLDIDYRREPHLSTHVTSVFYRLCFFYSTTYCMFQVGRCSEVYYQNWYRLKWFIQGINTYYAYYGSSGAEII